MKATVSPHQIKKIITAQHHDPFSLLGMHELVKDGAPSIVVRTYQPDALSVRVLPEGGGSAQEMSCVRKEGFFEAVCANADAFFPYRLEIESAGGAKSIIRDPYSFPPVLGDFDLHLFAEGNHLHIYERLGSHRMRHEGAEGFLFAVWAPNAARVSVVGDFNGWDGRRHPMRARGASGVWELFIPGFPEGGLYKYELRTPEGAIITKADPYAFFCEMRPKTASIAHTLSYEWADGDWMRRRETENQLAKPISIYEVHLGSWRRVPEEDARSLTYREAALLLVPYVKEMGFTHVEFLPLAAHPYDPSWGYQVTGYYSPTPRFGEPEDLMYLIDCFHQSGIGVLLDWVPAHFPTDSHALALFDGTALYEHADPRQGFHPDWNTLIFNYGRNEVRNFLTANALFWLENYHIDGLRVDAVASMLYLDYSRKEGEWIPNRYGGRENLDAIHFLQRLNEIVYSRFPGVLTIAEESTAWPAVSRPTYLGGLGFALKWNMGWMHDMLTYISKDPVFRKHHHNMLTFALLYAFHENFVLPISHDEIVHGKGALIGKMPGDRWQQFANLRLLLGYMFTHPGKKLLFMGAELGQWSEWNYATSLEWHLLEYEPHLKIQAYVQELNRLYRTEPSLHEVDFEAEGFEWIDFSDWESSIVAFLRISKNYAQTLIVVCNFTPVTRTGYRIGVPWPGWYEEVLNTDSELWGGTNLGNAGGVQAEPAGHHGRPCSMSLTVPPLTCLVFKPRG